MNREEITNCTIKPIGNLLVGNLTPSYMLHFHKEGKAVGSFDFNEGKMHFEGELTESGKIFVDWVIEAFKQRLEDAVKAEREACAKVCEQTNDGTPYNLAEACAEAIRARGNHDTR
jgi:hypothetical protein